jgi:DNA-binding NtrC family response regulator
MTDVARKPVLLAHRMASVRRILRANLHLERIPTTEAADARECADAIRACRPSAVVLDPTLITEPCEDDALLRLVRRSGAPVLVVSEDADHRRTARCLGDAPFCNRPDDVDRVTTAVLGMLAGTGLPSLV